MRWWPRRRPDHLDLRVRLLRLEDLFAEPELDPFLPEHAPYDERTGVEQLLGRLRPSKRTATASVTVELAEGADDPGAEERARGALDRYCRRKMRMLAEEMELSRRFGYRSLLWGFVAVVVLNGLAEAINDDWDPIASGLSVASWVILWVPVNLLVYDLYYLRRDTRGYQKLIDAPLTITAAGPAVAPER
ncbi:MAG TPA: hypothetical protein VM844_08920 [Miltoncostaeaceae bacterium]|jgi:hypothetical protein|nr:hypothetical protein [Miltoncostaeaceae bacterium]